MRSSTLAVFGLVLVNSTSAHYFFGRLILDGKWTDTWSYIRQISPSPTVPNTDQHPGFAFVAPNLDPNSLDVRCGRNASTLHSRVQVATVTAGDTVGFGVGEAPLNESPYMYHPGFASAWLSRAPDGDLDSYTGDGDWFKIFSFVMPSEQSRDWASPEWAPSRDAFKSLWGTFMLDSANFTIPATTPAGKYLLRYEHIFPNKEDAQYYVNCAHIEVLNSGTAGNPAPLVKIPGVYRRGQPDVYFSTYDLALATNFNLSLFAPPQPEVWRG
jgi:hypothetical protein